MLIHFPLSEAKTMQRPYGTLYWITSEKAGFKNMRVHIIEVDPKQRTSKHSHVSEELFFVLKGNAIFRGSNKEFRVKEKDVVLVSPNEVHQIENDNEQNSFTYLLAMSPPRNKVKVVYVDDNNG